MQPTGNQLTLSMGAMLDEFRSIKEDDKEGGWVKAHLIGFALGTLRALERRKLIEGRKAKGWLEQEYRITEEGEKALEELPAHIKKAIESFKEDRKDG